MSMLNIPACKLMYKKVPKSTGSSVVEHFSGIYIYIFNCLGARSDLKA